MRKSYRNKSKKRSGGAATVMPLQYFKADAPAPAAAPGHDLLRAIAPIGVRAKIGGRRTRRHRKSRGGFVPSVMEGFVSAASKYLVPIALFAGYKLMSRKGKKGAKRSRHHTRRH